MWESPGTDVLVTKCVEAGKPPCPENTTSPLIGKRDLFANHVFVIPCLEMA